MPYRPMPDLATPRAPQRGLLHRQGNADMYAWLFMRVSGVLLVVLIFGHLFVNLVSGRGIQAIDFAFVAGKWANPLWQLWDLVMLWLAMAHGTNGVRTIINDYAERSGARLGFKIVLYGSAALVVILGTLVIFTFNPCPPSSPADLLPSFCNG